MKNTTSTSAADRFLRQEIERQERKFYQEFKTSWRDMQCDYCGSVDPIPVHSIGGVDTPQCNKHWALGELREFGVWRKQMDVARWRNQH